MFAKRVMVGLLTAGTLLASNQCVSYAHVIAPEFYSAPVLNTDLLPISEDIMNPLWNYTYNVRPSVSVSGKNVTGRIDIIAMSGISIKGNLFIERYNGRYWEVAGRWYLTGNGAINTSRSITGISGSRYRTRFNGYAGSDWINITSNEAVVQ